jgi:cytosine/adenosine deaminase-related metal-dependent hydrolase
MLRSGVTTFVDYTPMRPDWIEEVKATGIRTCLAPSFRSGTWYTADGHEVLYEWDVPAGERAMREAFDLLDDVAKDSSGLLTGMVAPGQIDTCAPELLQAARDEALRRKLPMTLHAAQSVVEFREIFRRHGMTPIQWLEHLELLGPHFIIGHAIFCDHHSWLTWPDRDDLGRIAASGASIAHCPNQFARGGVTLEDFRSYRAAGVNIGIGTDTNPHNMIDEMRWAAMLAKVTRRDVDAGSTASVFEAATVGGAKALHCPDIGKLEVGCKPDVVLVDLTHPYLQPLRDPLRTMLFCALERPIRDVFVAGRRVVEDGRVTTIDLAPEIEELNAAQPRALSVVQEKDWAGRTGDEAFPRSLPLQ